MNPDLYTEKEQKQYVKIPTQKEVAAAVLRDFIYNAHQSVVGPTKREALAALRELS